MVDKQFALLTRIEYLMAMVAVESPLAELAIQQVALIAGTLTLSDVVSVNLSLGNNSCLARYQLALIKLMYT